MKIKIKLTQTELFKTNNKKKIKMKDLKNWKISNKYNFSKKIRKLSSLNNYNS